MVWGGWNRLLYSAVYIPGPVVYNSPYLSPADGLCNAVWDEKLSLCYGLLECTCSHMVGVKVHADTMGCLTNKVLYMLYINLL